MTDNIGSTNDVRRLVQQVDELAEQRIGRNAQIYALRWLLAEAREYAEFWRQDARTYGPQGHLMDMAWALPWEVEADA